MNHHLGIAGILHDEILVPKNSSLRAGCRKLLDELIFFEKRIAFLRTEFLEKLIRVTRLVVGI